MNKLILGAFGFEDKMTLVAAKVCPICTVPVDESKFKDELSIKEFKISGLCQKCQDDIFKEKERCK